MAKRPIADIDQDRQSAETRNNLAQKFEPLTNVVDRLERQAGDVATRPRQTRLRARLYIDEE